MGSGARRFFGRMAGVRLLPAAWFAVLPVLLVRLQYVAVPAEAARLWPECFLGDTRSWWKAVAVAGIGLWMLTAAGLGLAGGWRPRHFRLALLVLAAAAATLASTWLSPYPVTAWLGYVTSYEGALVLLSYLIGIWYVAEMTEGPEAARFLLRLVGGAGLLNALLGMGEGLGWQFWQTPAGLWLMGAGNAPLLFRFAESRMAYGTVFQPNHYGMFMATAYALALGLSGGETSAVWRWFWRLAAGCSAAALLFSNSRAAVLVALGATLAVLAGKFYRLKSAGAGRKFYLLKFCLGLLLLSALLGAVLAGVPALRQAASRFARRSAAVLPPSPAGDYRVRGVELSANHLQINLLDASVTLWKESPSAWRIYYPVKSGGGGEAFPPVKSAGERLTFQAGEAGWRTAPLPGVDGAVLHCHASGNARLQAPGVDLSFITVGREILGLDPVSRQTRSRLPASGYRPTGWEGLMSGRGYIWGRIPALFLAAPWFGSGPGSFPLVFPNDDWLSRQRYAENRDEDKGHGVWATGLVQLGLAGLAAYTCLAAYVYWRLWTGRGRFRFPLLLAVSAYLACALTNDSTVGVTPIFCVLLGVGVSDAESGDFSS